MGNEYLFYNDSSKFALNMKEFLNEKKINYVEVFKPKFSGSSLSSEKYGLFKEHNFGDFKSLIDCLN